MGCDGKQELTRNPSIKVILTKDGLSTLRFLTKDIPFQVISFTIFVNVHVILNSIEPKYVCIAVEYIGKYVTDF